MVRSKSASRPYGAAKTRTTPCVADGLLHTPAVPPSGGNWTPILAALMPYQTASEMKYRGSSIRGLQKC